MKIYQKSIKEQIIIYSYLNVKEKIILNNDNDLYTYIKAYTTKDEISNIPIEYINQYKNITTMTNVIKNKHNNCEFFLNKELNGIKSIPELEIKLAESYSNYKMILKI